MTCPMCNAKMTERTCSCGAIDRTCSGCGQWGSGHAHGSDISTYRVIG